ncbi:hypothetical protein [Corallococcus llansteffanensis]|uniref:Lipoprotein n=1 Tax=Corallococcus llansteffanensis TaxID=2316731 RepID=A0A3A8QDG5_9BACT|nr:hypothetical protein [Corallococcus llansteffanensis]RKH64325.1 hypothetical protein D7V93_07565 [Corallococcus llansteffanensis]
MKPLFVAASLALGLCSCAESPPVVQILQTKQPSAACVVAQDAPGIARGRLNLRYGRNYVVGLIVNSNYANTPTEVGGVPLDPNPDTGGQGTAFVDSVKLSFDADSGASIPDQTLPYTAGLNPSSEGNLLVLSLITADVYSALLQAVPTNADPVQVQVTIQLTGKYAGSSSFESNEVTFSIDVDNRDVGVPTCAAGEVPESAGPCGNSGQDNVFPSCTL